MTHLHGFFIALSLLSIVPISRLVNIRFSDATQRVSIIFYPWVGCILAIILGVFSLFLIDVVPTGLAAAMTLFSWVVLTGGLHLDGMADSIDGFFASHKANNPEPVLRAMKDSACGSMAIIALILLFLIKWQSLVVILQHEPFGLLGIVSVLVLARSAALAIMLSTPYASDGGIASFLKQEPPSAQSLVSLLLVLCLLLMLVPLMLLVLLLGVTIVMTYVWRRLWLSKIGGFSGDTLGGLIELLEVVLLLILVLAI